MGSEQHTQGLLFPMQPVPANPTRYLHRGSASRGWGQDLWFHVATSLVTLPKQVALEAAWCEDEGSEGNDSPFICFRLG